MRKIPIDSAESGMVLARDVTNPSGAVLFPQGAELDERMISRLKGLQVDFIFVEGHSEPRMSKELYLKKVEQALSKAEMNTVMQTIRDTLLKHIEAIYE